MAVAPARSLPKVVAWMIGALLSFSVVALSIRELAAQLSVFEILALRNIGGLIILACLALFARGPDQVVVPSRFPIHLLRNTVHFAGQSFWTYGLTVLPLATVFAIEFTTPAWVALLAVLFLKEKMTPTRALAVVFGLIGILIILRPGLEGFRIEALAVAAAAFCFAVQITTTKFLTGSNTTWTILFWMNFLQLPMNLAGNLVIGGPILFADKVALAPLAAVIGIMVSGFTAHYCLTNAFRHGDAIIVIPMDFLRVPLIGIVAWVVYGERPELAVFIGVGVIITGILINLWDEARNVPKPDGK